jgi:hypothetical protein
MQNWFANEFGVSLEYEKKNEWRLSGIKLRNCVDGVGDGVDSLVS